MGRLHNKCNRLQLLATCSITITNKQNHIVIDYNYDIIENNHNYNRNYICLETSSECKQNPFAWFDVCTFSDAKKSMQKKRNYYMNIHQCKNMKLLICKDQTLKKNTLMI